MRMRSPDLSWLASFETVALDEGDGSRADAIIDLGPAGGELGGGKVGLKVEGA